MGGNLVDPVTNQSVFTFLSEFNVTWEGQTVIEVFVLSTIFVLALIGNSMVLCAVFRNPKLRTATNLLICNLATTDILFAAGIPFIAITRVTQNWVLGNFVCKTVTYVQFVSSVCSIVTMMVVSVERYVSVCMVKRHHLTKRDMAVILFAIWVIATSFPLPVAIAQTVKVLHYSNGDIFQFCGIEWWDGFNPVLYLGAMATLFFIIPLTVITVFYLQILRIVKRSISRTQTTQTRSEKSARKQIRLLKMFSSIVVLFVIMWLPFFIISFLGVHYKQMTSTDFTISLVLALGNTCQNPVLYGYFNYRFREEFRNMCCTTFLFKHSSRAATYEVQETELNSTGQNSSVL